MKRRISSIAVLGTVLASIALAQPASQPAVLKASDTDTIKAAVGNEVVIEGVVASARWSGSGKVCEIKFEGTPDDGFTAVVFERNRKSLDDAFGGDFTKNFTSATLRIRGRLREYNGRSERLKGRIELTIDNASAVTVVTPAATQPS